MNLNELSDAELENYLKARKQEIDNDNIQWEKDKQFYEKRSKLRAEYEKITPEDKKNAIDFEYFCLGRGLIFDGSNEVLIKDNA